MQEITQLVFGGTEIKLQAVQIMPVFMSMSAPRSPAVELQRQDPCLKAGTVREIFLVRVVQDLDLQGWVGSLRKDTPGAETSTQGPACGS